MQTLELSTAIQTIDTGVDNVDNAAISAAEPLTPCCDAPFYAATVPYGPDGQPSQSGTFRPVRKCMACGETYPENSEKRLFVIDSEKAADWYLKTMAEIEAEKVRIKAQVEKRLKELDTDAADLRQKYGAQLEAFGREEAKRRRSKTVTLLQGDLVFRSFAPSLQIASQQDAITTAKAIAPDLVKEETVTTTTTEFDAKGFLKIAKAKFEATGEVLPGTERTEARETFKVVFPSAPKETPAE